MYDSLYDSITLLRKDVCLLQKKIEKLERDKLGKIVEKENEILGCVVCILCPKCSYRIDFHLKRFGEREIICTNCFENIFVTLSISSHSKGI